MREIDEELSLVVKSWRGNLKEAERLQKELEGVASSTLSQNEVARRLIKQGATTGDKALDIAIGICDTLDEQSIGFWRELGEKVRNCVGQYIVMVQPENRRDGKRQSLIDNRITVGRISSSDLIVDWERGLVWVASSHGCVVGITNHNFFTLAKGVEFTGTNFQLNHFAEDDNPLLIGDASIENWFSKHGPRIYVEDPRPQSIWKQLIAPLITPPTPS